MVHATMRRRPAVEIRLAPPVIYPGDTLDVDARFVSKAQTPVDKIKLTLQGIEIGRYSVGKSSYTVQHTWVALEAAFEAVSLTPGAHRYRARFPLPRELPPSSRAMGISVEYTLRVEVDIPWWPDVDTRYTVVVSPPAVMAAAAPWVFRSHEGEVRDRALYAECSLVSVDVAPGGLVTGRVSFGNVRHHTIYGIEAAFVATRTIKTRDGARTDEVERYTARIAEKAPAEGAPVAFRVRLPSEASYAYDGAVTALSWSLEIGARHTLSLTPLLSIPLRVVPLLGEHPEDLRGTAAVGRARRAQLWAEVGHRAGLHHDPEDDTLRATVGPVSVTIFAEDRPNVGTRTVARFRRPTLGLDLALRPARWADVFGTRHRVGDPRFDDALHLTGRDPAQLLALLTAPLRAQLLHCGEVALDDTGGTVSIPGAGVDAASMHGFVARVLDVARSLADAEARVPVPVPLAEHAAAWRDYAGRVSGRFEPGRAWVHEGRYGTERFEMGHRWGDAETALATVIQLHFDDSARAAMQSLGATGTGALDGLTDAAQAQVEALCEGGATVTPRPEGLLWERPGLTAEPHTLEPTLDLLARLARALRGQREGAVFR